MRGSQQLVHRLLNDKGFAPPVSMGGMIRRVKRGICDFCRTRQRSVSVDLYGDNGRPRELAAVQRGVGSVVSYTHATRLGLESLQATLTNLS